jgi:hypothetical protein
MKTIFNVYVPMQDQAQCDRMKQVCIDNGLGISKYSSSFEFYKDGKTMYFRASIPSKLFFVSFFDYGQEVTESEFINLLKEYKNETKK